MEDVVDAAIAVALVVEEIVADVAETVRAVLISARGAEVDAKLAAVVVMEVVELVAVVDVKVVVAIVEEIVLVNVVAAAAPVPLDVVMVAAEFVAIQEQLYKIIN